MRTRAGSDPNRKQPPPPMPAVGARRFTRVFVPPRPKPAAATRLRRSGNRLTWDATAPQEDGDERNKDTKPSTPPPPPAIRAVYKRKRRETLPSEDDEDGGGSSDRRFGIVFTRKHKRPKPSAPPLPPPAAAFFPCSSSRDFAARARFLDDARLLALLDGQRAEDDDGSDAAAVLVVLVDAACPGAQFTRFLLPVLRWMRQGRRGKLRSLSSFLDSSLALLGVFASRGLHFVRLRRAVTAALLHRREAVLRCGWCELHVANRHQQQPVLSVNFAALPSYFQDLHSALALRSSVYMPAVIRQAMGFVDPRDHLEEADSGSPSAAEPRRMVVQQDYVPLEQVAGVVLHGVRLKKLQRKRSSMRHPALSRRRPSVGRFPARAIALKQSALASQTALPRPTALTRQQRQQEVSDDDDEPVQPKPALEISLDLLENMDDSDVSTPMGPNGMQQRRYSFKSPTVECANKRLAMSEVRQNIDTLQCKANLLIVQADRGWREAGALVMLELSNSNGWCVAVKLHGVTRVSLKPSEQRFYVVNRYTHAYVWAVEDGWKLEFPDKWDWLLFKELHIEGRERNSQAKTIPIPGVNEVSDGTEGAVKVPFLIPVPDYIRTADDEVARALSRDSAYDMDSEDEQWLIQLKHGAPDRRSTRQNQISYEDFERIITVLEKDAYSNPEEASDVEQLLSRHPALGKGENVLAICRYWINKRHKKGTPLLRIFQVAPVRRGRLSQKSSVKKKRSFKRQRSQTGRGKPGFFLQDNAQEESALQRVVDAERAATEATEKAVELRARAQALMADANLAAYKASMAARIAEAASVSDLYRDHVCRALLG